MIGFRKYIHKHLRFWRIIALLLILATIVLGILWFLNPQGNYEPLIYVIGALAALIGVPTLADALAPDLPRDAFLRSQTWCRQETGWEDGLNCTP